MTPERAGALVLAWARRYTRGLPAADAQRRVEELAADLHDQIAHERAHGTGEHRIALGILSRMLRGVAADAAWRRRGLRASPGGPGRRTRLRSGLRVPVATGALLLVPLVAMAFTDEVAWTAWDFAVAAVLLGGAGYAAQRMLRAAGDVVQRLATALTVASALLLVWLVGAVGVIGQEGDHADLLYAGVLAVGAAGVVTARLRPRGMAHALAAMALTQMLVAVAALLAGRHHAPGASVAEIIGLNAFFAVLFGTSAALFLLAHRRRAAAHTQPGPPVA